MLVFATLRFTFSVPGRGASPKPVEMRRSPASRWSLYCSVRTQRLIARLAILHTNRMDHAFAQKPVMLFPQRRKHRIRTITIERTGKITRQLAMHDEIRRITLGLYRGEIVLKEGIVRIRA